jgi:hypothetical protein
MRPVALRAASLVMKGGRIYEPARIEAALGITPARRAAL